MTHDEFVEAYNAGRISLLTNRRRAIALLGNPVSQKKYRTVMGYWTLLFLLCFPAAILCFTLVKWWVGLIVVAFGIILARGMVEYAAISVHKQALENEAFYHLAIKSKGIMISEEP